MVDSMDCSYCNLKIDSSWSYCPNCGHKVEKNNLFVNLINKHLDLFRQRFTQESYKKEIKHPISGITISITAGPLSPHVSIGSRTQELQHYRSKQKSKPERKLPKKIIEPDVMIQNLPNTILVDVNLPGVRTEDDVEIENFPNSIELKAFTEDKGYFKIINIPQHFSLAEKKLTDEKLRLRFSI